MNSPLGAKKPVPGKPGSAQPGRQLSSVAGGQRAPRPGSKEDTLDFVLKQVLADAANAQAQEDEQKEVVDESVAAPLVQLVNSLLKEAVKRNASDMHIEPFEGILRVRFRIDGVLHEVQKLPFRLTSAVVSRMKIMADMDIVEKRIPQDGSIRFRSPDGVEADFRVNTLPSVFGEKIVLRVLGKTNLNNDLSKLGFPETQLKTFRKAIQKPDGLVLVTGPTGSGKTTTLYAALNELNDISVSVFTAEDPVEGTLAGITQVQVNDAVGLNFPSILRSLLRQDPDVILVGEIRDKETAEIAIKASLTGHLVLSTLHTNDAVATIFRLLNIGIEPYLIASSVNAIVAQRLVRKICENCKEQRQLTPEVLKSLGLAESALGQSTVAHGKGCDVCTNTGYKGRAPLYEILSLSDELRTLILKGVSKRELKHLARIQGMVTLRGAGMQLVRQGITSIEEVLGITNEDEEESN